MPSRFQTALSLAREDLRSRTDVDGILLFGSALHGAVGPTSDLDLYVILTGAQEGTQISLRRYAGVPVELHLATAETWAQMLRSGKPVVMTGFATGESLLDVSGALAELTALARSIREAGPPTPSQWSIDRWRFRLTDLADDLEDVAGEPANERLLGAQLVSLCLEAYCELHRLWGDKLKRRLEYIDRYDPELGRLARTYFAGGLDQHLAQVLVDRVLAPFGGRVHVWESTPEPPPAPAPASEAIKQETE